MVGVPRSKGCRICVQRRVKCDQTRPVCNNCLKGNRPCPGYDSDLRIHDEGTKLRRRYGPKDVSDTKTDSDSSSPSTSLSTESSPEESTELVTRHKTPYSETTQGYRGDMLLPSRNPFFSLLENQIYPDADPLDSRSLSSSFNFNDLLDGGSVDLDIPLEMAPNNSVYSPFLVQEQLLNTFSSAMGTTAGNLVLPRHMQSHTRWLSQLPRLFGTKLLDSAVRAVSLIHLGRVQQLDVLVHESSHFYGKALRLLNQSLTDHTKGMSTETLSATILLSFYEMFASDSNESWVRHAGGAGTLMRIRGPARHLHGVDRDVYLAYRHTIVIDAFQRDEPCFLSEPEWLELSKTIHEDLRSSGLSKERLEIFDLAEEFYLESVFVPTTFSHVRKIPEARLRLNPEQFKVYEESILERCRQHRTNLKSINLRFRAALKKIGLETTTYETLDPVFPIQYGYVNVFIGSTHVGHWTILLLLNIILKEMEMEFAPEKTGLYLMENREIAREICRTTPFMLTSSFHGPFFIIFALRLCLMVFEPGMEREWVIRKLVHIGQTHMKMAADIPVLEPDSSISSKGQENPGKVDVDVVG
ncbi:uncharacterized protein Z518_00720 [Rhinocladiella mackenziei CBS 650.93]|uniref:Rhinocladiella mackenziei CBS 650.93 unplaced genomic scaffold supercont1.1, whole genome shotgun sequence n=1 Tax=Rhinocladiella mackenziei CBS 650.93 TaxID=1442369 RepID=A0A0D2IUA3_9EURO|nr:uncharacterized protein Z518_00720 [Rhinocladiella mackenziei CBS 650.93]KIX09639.1 hypothetical protein Z518_00720 [Rhinocladiella mackenziei CBS 650.93]